MDGRRSSTDAAFPAAGGFVLVAVAAALWGSDALFRRGLALDLPSSSVVVYEHVILVALVLPVLPTRWRELRSLAPRDWASVAVVGFGASALATLLFTAAFRYGDPTTPLLLQKLQPLVAIGGATLLLGERLLPRYAVYFVVALAATFLVSFPDPAAVGVATLVPALLAIGAASLWGLGTVLGRHLTRKMRVSTLTALRFAFGLPAAAAFVLVDQGPSGFVSVAADDVLPLLLLALVPGLIALLVYYRGLDRTPASLATLAELAFPAAAITLNYVAFGTTLTTTQWTGVILLAATITAMSMLSRMRGGSALGVTTRSRPGFEPSA